MENKEVVDIDEAKTKIASAVQSRNSDDFLIAARTDSRATHGLDEALRRGDAFLCAGADILFIEAPQSIEEMQRIKSTFPEVPLIANMVEGGKTPELSLEQIDQLGFKIVLRPVTALLSATDALQRCYSALLNESQPDKPPSMLSFDEYNKMIGLPDHE